VNPQRLEERRAFNEALRARIRSFAAAHGLSDSEIKWLGRLRHYDMVVFVQKHRLSWPWVLCGGGPPIIARWSPRVVQGGRQ
jgi:hypothetical protein